MPILGNDRRPIDGHGEFASARARALSLSIPLAGIDEVLAAVREQMLLAGNVVLNGGRCRRFPRVDVQTVLTLLREADGEDDDVVVGDAMRHVLGQPFLLDAVLVQSRHEVRQRSRHAKLYLQLPSGEHQRFLEPMDRAIVKRSIVSTNAAIRPPERGISFSGDSYTDGPFTRETLAGAIVNRKLAERSLCVVKYVTSCNVIYSMEIE